MVGHHLLQVLMVAMLIVDVDYIIMNFSNKVPWLPSLIAQDRKLNCLHQISIAHILNNQVGMWSPSLTAHYFNLKFVDVNYIFFTNLIIVIIAIWIIFMDYFITQLKMWCRHYKPTLNDKWVCSCMHVHHLELYIRHEPNTWSSWHDLQPSTRASVYEVFVTLFVSLNAFFRELIGIYISY